MNKPIVVDASVVLAVLLRELEDADALSGAVMSAVNLAEVLSRASDLGVAPAELQVVLRYLHSIAPFTERHAHRAGELRPITRHAGLSLGDRACLALALELDADVYTADRAWATLDLPLAIHLIR